MSLTERTTSPTFEDVTPPGEEARPPAGSATTWRYLRSLSGAPEAASAGPSDGPDWADDRRLDELFSAWSEAALAADVVTDRGHFRPVDEPRWTPPAPVVADVPAHDPAPSREFPAYGAYEPPAYPASPADTHGAPSYPTSPADTADPAPSREFPAYGAYEAPANPASPADTADGAPSYPAYGTYPAYPADDDIGPGSVEPETLPVWSRDDDEIIPQRRGRRWGMRRR